VGAICTDNDAIITVEDMTAHIKGDTTRGQKQLEKN